MNEGPRYVTLRDYLRVVREHWLLITFVTLAAAGLALGTAVTQEPTFNAKASLAFQDQSQDLGLIGVTVASNPTPEKLAEANARTITRPDVVRKVKESLGTGLSARELSRSLTAHVEPKSNLVVLEAKARKASFAARLANEFARQGADATNRDARSRFATAAENLQRRARRGRGAQDANTRLALGDQVSRLQSLSVLARPATIEEVAQVPSAPTSPRPAFRSALGLLGGLLLGVLAAFLRDSLDRRLRDSNEIKAHLDLPLLALVRADALGRAAYALNGHEALAATDFEAFRILRTNLEFLSPSSRLGSVVVTSALPEEGKTTVSSGLAAAAATAGRRTLLMECDLRRPTIAGRLGLQPSPGLTDFLQGHATPDEVLQAIAVEDPPIADDALANGSGANGSGTHPHRLVCMTAGSRTAHPAELLASAEFQTLLEEVTQAYELVIIDTSPVLPVVDTLELLPLVGGIVLCVRAQRTTRDQALAAKSALDHLPTKPTGIVVTGTVPRFEGGHGYYSYGYSEPSARKLIRF